MKDFRAAALGMCTRSLIKDIHVPICVSRHQDLFMLNVKVISVLTLDWYVASGFVL